MLDKILIARFQTVSGRKKPAGPTADILQFPTGALTDCLDRRQMAPVAASQPRTEANEFSGLFDTPDFWNRISGLPMAPFEQIISEADAAFLLDVLESGERDLETARAVLVAGIRLDRDPTDK